MHVWKYCSKKRGQEQQTEVGRKGSEAVTPGAMKEGKKANQRRLGLMGHRTEDWVSRDIVQRTGSDGSPYRGLGLMPTVQRM